MSGTQQFVLILTGQVLLFIVAILYIANRWGSKRG